MVSAHNNDKVEVISHKLIYCEQKLPKLLLFVRNTFEEKIRRHIFILILACDLLIPSFATAAATETLESEKFHCC